MKGDMKEQASKWSWAIVVTLVFLIVVLFFIPYIITETKASNKYMSNMTTEKEEVSEGSPYRSLQVVGTDAPDVVAYKLFKNFDTAFLNETSGNRVLFNPFILNLGSNSYDILSGALTLKIRDGVIKFSDVDNVYQIGRDNQQPVTCGMVLDRILGLDFNNNCWTSAMDGYLNAMPSAADPCKIYVSSSTNNFDGSVKIRVGWYKDGSTSPSNQREIVYALITICDG